MKKEKHLPPPSCGGGCLSNSQGKYFLVFYKFFLFQRETKPNLCQTFANKIFSSCSKKSAPFKIIKAFLESPNAFFGVIFKALLFKYYPHFYFTFYKRSGRILVKITQGNP